MSSRFLHNKIVNQDIVESLQLSTELEDELCSQVGQLSALCAAQLTLANEGLTLSPANFIGYSQVLESYTRNLKQIVEQLYK